MIDNKFSNEEYMKMASMASLKVSTELHETMHRQFSDTKSDQRNLEAKFDRARDDISNIKQQMIGMNTSISAMNAKVDVLTDIYAKSTEVSALQSSINLVLDKLDSNQKSLDEKLEKMTLQTDNKLKDTKISAITWMIVFFLATWGTMIALWSTSK